MKSFVSLGLILLALSFCNLMGRRGANNSNSNTRPSGTSTETAPTVNSNAAETQQTPAPPPVDSSLPPPRNQNTAKNTNMTAPPAAAGPGVHTLPGVKQNSAASAPPAPRAPISGGVLNGRAISLPKPVYPPIAKAAHVSGTVMVQVTVDENGNVIAAHAVSGHPLLQGSAVAAARQAKFSPTKLSGQPVKVSGVIIYNFVAQ